MTHRIGLTDVTLVVYHRHMDTNATPTDTHLYRFPECSAEITTEGYWTCDIVGGCTDCRRIAEGDTDLLTEWKAERTEMVTEKRGHGWVAQYRGHTAKGRTKRKAVWTLSQIVAGKEEETDYTVFGDAR